MATIVFELINYISLGLSTAALGAWQIEILKNPSDTMLLYISPIAQIFGATVIGNWFYVFAPKNSSTNIFLLKYSEVVHFFKWFFNFFVLLFGVSMLLYFEVDMFSNTTKTHPLMNSMNMQTGNIYMCSAILMIWLEWTSYSRVLEEDFKFYFL